MDSYQITCKSCGASNRIPSDKQGVSGKCGKCHSGLPAIYWQPQPVNEATFDSFVRGYDGPILAEFWAPW
jgi:hypothetical protein